MTFEVRLKALPTDEGVCVPVLEAHGISAPQNAFRLRGRRPVLRTPSELAAAALADDLNALGGTVSAIVRPRASTAAA